MLNCPRKKLLTLVAYYQRPKLSFARRFGLSRIRGRAVVSSWCQGITVGIQTRKGKLMNLSKQSNLMLTVVLCAVIGVMATSSRGNSTAAAVENQDPSSLDRRISLLEQRFYSIESSISRLQQYVAAQRPAVTTPSTSDRDVLLIRDEIQRLSLRMSELECGLTKLDERTTPANRRNATPKSNDPCRLNVDTPVRLSARP